jgi:hypothetical protein
MYLKWYALWVEPNFLWINLFQEKLSLARWCFKQYLDFLRDNRPEALTLVAHLCMHLCDDAERFQTHLGAISCYQFENFEKIFGEVRYDIYMQC